MVKPLEKGLLRAATQQVFHLFGSELTPSLTDGTHTEPQASAEYSTVIKSRGLLDKRNGPMKLTLLRKAVGTEERAQKCLNVLKKTLYTCKSKHKRIQQTD